MNRFRNVPVILQFSALKYRFASKTPDIFRFFDKPSKNVKTARAGARMEQRGATL
jgi:hypothetical protein